MREARANVRAVDPDNRGNQGNSRKAIRNRKGNWWAALELYGKRSLTYVQKKFVPQPSLCAPFIWLCALFIWLCALYI